MACVSPRSSIEVSIPLYENDNEDKVTRYLIQIRIGDFFWRVSHRYSTFADLHEALVSSHGIAKDLLPPKKIIGNKNIDFIKKRQKCLEEYLQVGSNVDFLCQCFTCYKLGSVKSRLEK